MPRTRKRPAAGAEPKPAKMAKPAAAKAARPKSVKSSAGRDDNADSAILGGIGVAELRRLIRLVQRTGIGELEVSAGGRAVRISTVAGAGHAAGAAMAPVVAVSNPGPAAAGNAAPAPAKSERFVAITSPMVGTFYRAPAPDADPYLEVGSMVEIGQTVCIVEAMKLMNEIESEIRGRVMEILVDNAQPVEFGQKLFLIDPA